MSRERRVRKLEARSPNTEMLPIVFFEICGIKKGTEETTRVVEKRHGPATIPGLGLGRVFPHEGESKQEFQRRIFAIRAGGKMTEDMTKDELAAAYAIADQKLQDSKHDD